MDKTQKMIKSKKHKFFVITTITTALVITLITITTLLAYKLPWKYDMTMQQLFTLSGQSISIVNEITETVEIAAVYPNGKEEMMVVSLLDEYAKSSKNIEIEYVDIEKNPTALEKYKLDVPSVTNGTIIVKSGKRTKIIESTSLFETTIDGNMFNGEREITGAIRYVTAIEMPIIYFIEGHEEASPSKEMTQATSTLQLDAYEVKTLSLLHQNKVPDDADILIFASPKVDITIEEKIMIEDYLKKGGKIMFMVDSVMNTNSISLPNFNDIMNTYGIDIGNNFVVEEDPSGHLSSYKMYLVPGYGPHEITKPIGENRKLVVLPVVRALGTVPYNEEEVSLNALLLSSTKSWIRADMTIPVPEKTELDINGPAVVAYATSKSNSKWGNPPSRMVVIGNSSFSYDGNIEAQANRDLFINSINWLQGDRNSDIISGKAINGDRLMIRGNDFINLLAICIIILPLIPFICALRIWILRRNK